MFSKSTSAHVRPVHSPMRIPVPSSVIRIGRQAVVALCRQEGMPYYILGNGSNLLVSDKGYRGTIIQIYKEMNDIHIEGMRRDNFRQQIKTLADAGKIVRYEKGIYYIPKKTRFSSYFLYNPSAKLSIWKSVSGVAPIIICVLCPAGTKLGVER